MKYMKYFIASFMAMFLGVSLVSAAQVEASFKVTGRNTFGRELEAKVECVTPSDADCRISDVKWYYSDENSTTGGTRISDATSRNYKINKDYVGKYIYAEATISATGYDDVVLKDITDADNNVTAKVDDYIKAVAANTYSIEATAQHEVGASLKITVKGIENKDAYNYYVIFGNDDTAPTLIQDENGCNNLETSRGDFTNYKMVSNTTGEVSISYDWYMVKGYTNAYVIKRTYDRDNGGYYCEITDKAITVEKPAVPALGTKYQFYLFTDKEFKGLSTFPLFPYTGENGSHKINTKIGLISDTNLLKKLANNTSDALTSLLEYAKSSEGTTFTYTDEHYNNNDIGSFKVTDGKYYYIYTSYDNTDGLYRDFDDVTVVMGYLGMLVNDVKWESSDSPKVENPKTGIINYTVGATMILVIGATTYLVVRKKTKFPQV